MYFVTLTFYLFQIHHNDIAVQAFSFNGYNRNGYQWRSMTEKNIYLVDGLKIHQDLSVSQKKILRLRPGDRLCYNRSGNIEDDDIIDTSIYPNVNQSGRKVSNIEENLDIVPSLNNQLEAPDVKKIIMFAIPAIGIWLCGPILSLIDTSAVGLLSGTAQQAALNPAITIAEDGALLVSFMYTATTNLVAAAHEFDRGSHNENKSVTRTTIKTALQIGGMVGLIFGIVLFTSATILLKSLIGKGQEMNFEVLSAAERYVKIRALGMPAAVIIGSAQSACLGMKDIRSPLVVMVVAAFVNFIGDVILVRNTYPWVGGAAGAAWATVFSQYAALGMFLNWLKMKPFSKGSNSSKIISSRGVLHGHFRLRDLFILPSSKETIRKFWPYVVPVTTTAIGRVSGYIAMSHVVSSALGTIDMAAQQIVLAFFLCLVPMCDSLNLTAQSFVPGIFEFRGSPNLRIKVMKETTSNFLRAGGVFGLILAVIVACIPFISRFFTHDLSVIASVNSTTPYLAIYALLSGIVCSGEGLLLGQKDLKFLSNSFTAFFFVVPYVLLNVKRVALKGVYNIGLSSVWSVFTLYQGIRCIMWLLRIRQLSKNLEKNSVGV